MLRASLISMFFMSTDGLGWSGHGFLIKQLVRFGWVSKIGPTAMSEPTAVQRVHHGSLSHVKFGRDQRRRANKGAPKLSRWSCTLYNVISRIIGLRLLFT